MPPPKTEKTTVSPSRWIAYRTLSDWRAGKGYVEDLLAERWAEHKPRTEDLRLSQAIVYGAFRNLRRVDFWIDRLARKGIDSLPDPIIDCLRIALYQIAFLDRVPDHAAVSEATALCEKVGLAGMKGVVNGMLRAFPRRREELDGEIEASANRLAIETSHPDWLVAWALQKWGNEKGETWLRQNNAQPSLYLRPIATRLFAPDSQPEGDDRDKTAARLLQQRMGMGELAEDATSLRVPPSGDIAQLEAIREGLANVQDPSAQQAVRWLDPKPGETIYDLCAAPGGKAIQIADRTLDMARVYAVDASSGRLARVRENLDRCGFRSVETIRRDLSEPWPDPPALADAVLLDAPCSGLGTLRRRVDLRYRIQGTDIEELAAKSANLLENAARIVKPGGRLVYSTCTLTSEENRANVERFVERHSGSWKTIEMRDYPDWLGEGNPSIPDKIPDCDGAFIALVIRCR